MARHKVGLILLALLLLLVGATGGLAVYLNHKISGISRMDIELHPGLSDAGPSGAGSGQTRAMNILLAGVDDGEPARIADELAQGPWVPGSHRTDTIMVLHLTADRRQAYLISVPRDSWVPIDGYGTAKINAAFSYGGPKLFVHTMEQFTGLRMDHLAIVDWQGFKDLTDSLGGVTIEAANGQHVTLQGAEALRYVRERYSLPRGDLDRIQRQQNLLRAMSNQLRSSGALLNPLRLTKVISAVTDNVVVDKGLTDEQIRELALSLRHLDAADVLQLTVPVKRFDRIRQQSVVIVDAGKTRGLFGAVMADELDQWLATHPVDTLPVAAAVP